MDNRVARTALGPAGMRGMAGRLVRGDAARPGPRRATVATALLALLGAPLGGCGAVDRATSFLGLGGGPHPAQPRYVAAFLGAAAAEDPRAALVARDSLAAGGSAADAAVAAAFALTVTLPSRAGLGGGGACLFFDPRRNASEAVLFPAVAPPAPAPFSATAGADRPAAVPLMARGLFALHARFGRRPFEEAVVPAEQLARFGNAVSRALAADLATVGPPLLADPRAGAVFGAAGVGANLVQPELATTLAQIRTAGVGDFHQGALGRRVAEASIPAGGGLDAAMLRDAVPRTASPVTLRVGQDTAAFLPPPADGGLAAAAAFEALRAGADPATAGARALAVAAASRRGGAEPAVLLAQPPAGGGLGALPASTALAVLDNGGGAVSCAFSMNNLFGTGRMLPGLGFLLAAAPRPGAVEPPLLAASLVFNPNTRSFRYAGAGSGQAAAAMAVAAPMAAHLLRRAGLDAAMATIPEPGRGAAIGCPGMLPGASGTCQAAVDGRGAGLAVLGGGN